MRTLPWSLALLTLAAVGSPAGAQSFEQEQAKLEARLAQSLPVKTTEHRYEITRQGLAEMMDLQETIIREGWVSPRGWALQCEPLGRHLRQWVSEGKSLTRVYVGAYWLEYWGAFCQPDQVTSWSSQDVRLLARATARAAKAWPKEWGAIKPAYSYSSALRYLTALNQERSLTAPDRACLRSTLEKAATGEGPMEAALATWTTVCPIDPGRPPIEDALLHEELSDTPMAVAVSSPFLGVERWGVPPRDMASALARKDGNLQVMVDMMKLIPMPTQLVRRQGLLFRVLETQAAPEQREEFMAGSKADMAPLQALDQEWKDPWPSAQQCEQAGRELRRLAQQASNPDALHVIMHQISLTSLICPTQGWSNADRPWLTQAFKTTAESLPVEWTAVRAELGKPGQAEAWLKHVRQQEPRRQCILEQAAQARADGDVQGVAWLRARARCQPSYQTVFPADVRQPKGEQP